MFLKTYEAKIVKEEMDQKYHLHLRFDLLGGFVRCIESLVIVGWSIGIQFGLHQT